MLSIQIGNETKCSFSKLDEPLNDKVIMDYGFYVFKIIIIEGIMHETMLLELRVCSLDHNSQAPGFLYTIKKRGQCQ